MAYTFDNLINNKNFLETSQENTKSEIYDVLN
jgi:hypothetical protein